MHYYQRNLGDYAKDTGTLTQADHGAYGLLIDHYYSTEKPLPLDADDLYAIGKAGGAPEKKAVDRVLAKFFRRAADGYHHKRVDKELAAYHKKSANASASAQTRWAGAGTEDSANASNPDCERIESRIANGHADAMLTNNQEPTSPSLRSGERRRATRLSSDWQLPQELRLWAKQQQPTWDDGHVDFVVAQFRDYWIAAPKGAKLDWAATWRTWVRKEGAKPGTVGRGAVDAWWTSDAGIQRKGEELGMQPRPGETMGSYRDRIKQRIDDARKSS